MFTQAAEEKRTADLQNEQPDAPGDGPFGGGRWDDYEQPAPPQGTVLYMTVLYWEFRL
jgi:hypothetical protein